MTEPKATPKATRINAIRRLLFIQTLLLILECCKTFRASTWPCHVEWHDAGWELICAKRSSWRADLSVARSISLPLQLQPYLVAHLFCQYSYAVYSHFEVGRGLIHHRDRRGHRDCTEKFEISNSEFEIVSSAPPLRSL